MRLNPATAVLCGLVSGLPGLAVFVGHWSATKEEALLSETHQLQFPLPNPHAPSSSDGHRLSSEFWSNATLEKQVERLSAVVEVPSVCYDDLGDVDEDPRWEVFGELHDVLRNLFPLV